MSAIDGSHQRIGRRNVFHFVQNHFLFDSISMFFQFKQFDDILHTMDAHKEKNFARKVLYAKALHIVSGLFKQRDFATKVVGGN